MTSSRAAVARDDEGFTLVELLVALALLAVAAVLTAQGFSGQRRTLTRLESAIFAGETVSQAQDTLRSRLERLYARMLYGGGASATDFDGLPTSLAFSGSGATEDSGQQVQRYNLELRPSGDLVLSGPGRAQRLLADVDTLELGYWGADRPGAPPSWHDRWTGRLNPPELVRIRAAFRAGDRRAWPEMIVRPVVTVNADCIYDLDTGACRGES